MNIEIVKYVCENTHITQRVYEPESSIPDSVLCPICGTLAATAFVRMAAAEKYANRLRAIREIARLNGYAIAEHGSKARDYDLIAVPWVENAAPAEVLIEDIRVAIDGFIAQPPEDKPHGRRGWNIVIGADLYFDISVMPRR